MIQNYKKSPEDLSRHYKRDAMRLARKFNANGTASQQYRLAEAVGTVAYLGKTDKGQMQDPLSKHVRRVHDRVLEMYRGKPGITPERLVRLEMLAMLHEILELKDEVGQLIWSPRELAKCGFPKDVVDEVVALGKRPDELYLDYIQRLAMSPNAVLVKIADLAENTSPERHKESPHGAGAKFRDKKEILYPLAKAYLEAVAEGRIDPRKVSPADFAVFDPGQQIQNSRLSRLMTYTRQSSARDYHAPDFVYANANNV